MVFFYIPSIRLLSALVLGVSILFFVFSLGCIFYVCTLPVLHTVPCLTPLMVPAAKEVLPSFRQRFLYCAVRAGCTVQGRGVFLVITAPALLLAQCVWLCDCFSVGIESYTLTSLPKSKQYRLRVVL